MALTLDYNGLVRGGPQGEVGVSPEALERAAAAHAERLGEIRRRRDACELGFLDLPDDEAALEACLGYARRQAGRFENVVVLGIGGSALGTLALHASLSPSLHNLRQRTTTRPKLFIVDTVDPVLVSGVLRIADPDTTLFVVISKSGTTAETMSQFLLFLEDLKTAVRSAWKEHVVIITDPAKGLLRPFAEAHDLVAFSVPANVGGRFSVLSPVGLLPGAVMGWDLEALLAGAREGREASLREDFFDNPAALWAVTHHLLDTECGVGVQVLFPYCHRLRMLVDWQIQLVAESLGKRNGSGAGVGPTPHKALGPTDQHSQVQLFAQGPTDKVFTFMRVMHPRDDVVIPPPPQGLEELDYLQGKTFGQLLDAECRATYRALLDAGRPCCTVTFPRVSALTVGEWMMWMMCATAYGGMLYGVNAFDQPGVEAGKRATYGLMGRPGFEGEAERVRSAAATDPRYTVG